MRILILFFASLIGFCGLAQDNFKIYHEETDNGFKIVADNNEYCPVSVELNLNLENLSSSKGNNKVFIIPPRTSKHFITDLNVINPKKQMKLGFSVSYNYGDHTLKTYDKNYRYYLPFATGASFRVSQGYNGTISHQGVNALDFEMPMRTEIHAARGGIVVEVQDKYSKRCINEGCAKFNNYIVIYHDDGTFAEYTHIVKEGNVVYVGDRVTRGQLIAFSGDVGYATGPHLHFIVYYQRIKGRETVKTKFLTDRSSKPMQLKEKETYMRNY